MRTARLQGGGRCVCTDGQRRTGRTVNKPKSRPCECNGVVATASKVRQPPATPTIAILCTTCTRAFVINPAPTVVGCARATPLGPSFSCSTAAHSCPDGCNMPGTSHKLSCACSGSVLRACVSMPGRAAPCHPPPAAPQASPHGRAIRGHAQRRRKPEDMVDARHDADSSHACCSDIPRAPLSRSGLVTGRANLMHRHRCWRHPTLRN